MYFDYHKEKYGRDHILTDRGFIVYSSYSDKSVYVHQLYVKPEYRNVGEGKHLENLLVEKEAPIAILCYVDMESRKWEKALNQFTAHGYRPYKINENRIELIKDLRDA